VPDDLLELIAPGGCDEANHGTERWRVDNSGRIRVSREAADYLIRYGGFRPVPAAPDQAPAGASPAFAGDRFLMPETSPPPARRVPRSTK
jgi:hypothetical protein